jgi:hypothetical protein
MKNIKFVSILVLLFLLLHGILKFRIISKSFGTSGILVNVVGAYNISNKVTIIKLINGFFLS